MDVICPSCGGVYHETTKHYDGNRPATGKMFRLKHPYGPTGYNWSTFPQDPAVRFADLECPQCGSCYVGPDGRVRKLKLSKEEELEIEHQESLQEEFSLKSFDQFMEESFEQRPETQEEAEGKKVKKSPPRKTRGKK